MVRHRADPGGASRMTSSGQDPVAAVARGKDVEASIVDAIPQVIETRHVVDEIRDSDHGVNEIRDSEHARETIVSENVIDLSKREIVEKKEESSSSWFFFDWAISGATTNEKSAEHKEDTKAVPEILESKPETVGAAAQEISKPQRETVTSVKPDILSIFQREAQSEFVSEEFNSVLPVVAGKEVTSTIVTASSAIPVGLPQTLSITDELRNVEDVLSSPERKSVIVDQKLPEQDHATSEVKTDEGKADEKPAPVNPDSQKNKDPDLTDSSADGCLCFTTCEEPTVTSDTVEEPPKAVASNDNRKRKDQLTEVKSEEGILSTIFACIDPAPAIEVTRTENTETKTQSEKSLAPEAISPKAEAAKPADKSENADQASKLLGNDLESLPSVKDDVRDSVSPMKKEDLPSKESNKNSASLVESEVKHMKISRLAASLEEGSIASLRSGSSGKTKDDGSLNERQQLMIKELRSAIATFGRYDVRCANSSVALGDLLDEAGEYEHAIKLHKDAVTIYRCKLGDDHTTTLDAKIRLGTVLENAGQYDEAINTYYLVTVMRRGLKGEQDPSVADGLVCMGRALRKKGEYTSAIKELKRALKIYRESLGDSHEKVAATVDQIASTYVTLGDFDKSAAILEEVVKLKAATMGMKSKAVAVTLAHLATTYECSEKFLNALKALKKCYKIYTELDGCSSNDATSTLNRMAQLYEAMKDYNRASVAYLGVLRGRKIQHGADHLSVGETYFRLGHSLRATKQYDKALKCLKEALPIFIGQGVKMKDVKMVADIMHEMALVNFDRGHNKDAIRIYKQELSVRRKIGQPDFPFIAKTLKCLGRAEYGLKNHSRALKYLVEALTIFQERGDQGIECGEVLFYTGLVFDAVKNKDRALEAFVEAVRIFNDHDFDDDHPLLVKANKKIEEIKRS